MRGLAILSAAAFVWSSQAAAQVSDPYRNPWPRSGPIEIPGDFSKHDAGEVLRGFARCIVVYHGDAARRFVLLPLGSWVPEKDYRDIRDGRCMGLLSGRLEMGQFAYRGALAEELLRWDFSRVRAPALVSAPPLDWSVPELGKTNPLTGQPLAEQGRAAREAAHNVALAGSTVGSLAECVVRRAPQASRALLRTRSEPDERAAMQVLVPDIGQCAQASGTLKFNRSSLRQAVAVAYYRLASAAAGYARSAAK